MRQYHKLLLVAFGLIDIVLLVGVVCVVAFNLPGLARGEAPLPTIVDTAVARGPAATQTAAPPTPVVSPPTSELATPAPFTYTVVEGDTLWAIAERYRVSVEVLTAVNPNINPDQLRPGDVLVMPVVLTATPTPTFTPTPTLLPTNYPTLTPSPSPTATQPPMARVRADGQGLRLRESPGTAGPVLGYLDALTPLTLVGRTEDNAWLQVSVDDHSGWVMAAWVETFVDVNAFPVTGVAVMATETPTPLPTNTRLPATQTPLPSATLQPGQPTPVPVYSTLAPGAYPYITNVTDHARQIYLYGQTLGNRANVFSKVGDSITVAGGYLYPIGSGTYDLHDYAYLAPVIAHFSGGWARNGNSFSNVSLAAKGGWSAFTVNNYYAWVIDPNPCDQETETPLECEYRLVQPAVALIMLGTNDVKSTPLNVYEIYMRRIIETSINRGIIPVISTIPNLQRDWEAGRVQQINDKLRALAQEYDIPLWDYWAAMQGLPNYGLSSDGVHPSYVTNHAADFTPEYLQYGYTVRNLTALQALDEVWRKAIQP